MSEEFICECCDYYTSKKGNYDRHILTRKHNYRTLLNKKGAKKNNQKFYCEICDYSTSKDGNFDRHVLSPQQKRVVVVG